jgi:hypothetical protein
MDLYIHPPPVRLHGVVLNKLSTGTTLLTYIGIIISATMAMKYSFISFLSITLTFRLPDVVNSGSRPPNILHVSSTVDLGEGATARRIPKIGVEYCN